jgi:WS/DGAT/MGAT family acyltransferase
MDNMFLHLEHGNQHMHVAGLGIYDPSTAPGGFVRFKDILRFFEARLDTAPVFRRRLVSVPMDLDRPYWIEDPHVDVEYHVRHIALPYPGDWRQLCIQVARIHSRPLDRSKPLWEAYVIEGLDNVPGIPRGSFAFYTKFHHAAIDGEGGTEVMRAIHAFAPDELAPDEGARRTRVRDREPTQIELYTRAVVNNVQRVPRAARFSLQTVTRLAGLGTSYMGQLKEMLQEAGVPSVETMRSKVRRPPVTRFSGKVSAHRVVELVGVPFADIKAVRQKVEGATVNGVFMATVGGALNKYLDAKGELPERSMTAQVPMTLRGADKGEAGNQIGVAVMPLHSEIADPLERLRAIGQGADKAKALVGLVGKDLTKHVYDLLPAAASELFTRKVMLPTMNIVVSNVRGPDVPMYLAGAQMVAFAPVSIAIDGLGLNVTGFSYHGTLWICAVACRDMMPDPGFFADCLRGSFAELVAATVPSKAVAPAAKAGGAAKRKRRAAQQSKVRAPRRAAARGRRKA